MSGRVFVPHGQCKVASGDCFTEGKCLRRCRPNVPASLSADDLLVMAAIAQRRRHGKGSTVAARIDELLAELRRGVW